MTGRGPAATVPGTTAITTAQHRAAYERALAHENALTDRISTDDFSAHYDDPPGWAIGPFTRDPTMTFRQPADWHDPTGIGWTAESVFNPTLGIADGVLHLVYRASPRKESTSSRIGHAVLGPDGWVDDGGPILWPTLPNETLGVEDPKLYRADGRWCCFYNGIRERPDGEVGCDVNLAVSDDLVAWRKLGPVVPHEVSHGWAKGAVIPRNDAGEAVRIGGEYLMYLSEGCGDRLTVGRSDDLVHWTFAPEPYLDMSSLGPQLHEVACAVVDGDRLVLDFFHRNAAGEFAAAQALYDTAAPFAQLELHPGGSLAWGGLLRWEGDRIFAQGWDAPRGSRETYFYREDHHA